MKKKTYDVELYTLKENLDNPRLANSVVGNGTIFRTKEEFEKLGFTDSQISKAKIQVIIEHE